MVAMGTRDWLLKKGHEVEVFGMKHPLNVLKNEYFSDFVDYRDTRGLGKKLAHAADFVYNREAARRFILLLEKFKPDVIHFHNIYHQLSFSLLGAARKKNIPAVMTLHDYKLIGPNYGLFHHGKIGEECAGGRFYRCLTSNCLEKPFWSILATAEMYGWKWRGDREKIDRYLSPSEFLRKKLIDNGFPAEKIEVIHNPYFEKIGSAAGGKSVVDYVLYFGRLSKEKGLDALLDCAKLTPEIAYRVVGDGPLSEHLKQRTRAESIGNVIFGKRQDSRELSETIARAKLIVLPSVWYENYPMSVVEAKIAGKIVVASNIGGLPELLPKNLLFAPGNAKDMAEKIKYWWSAKETEIKKIGSGLREQALKQNSPEKYISDLLVVYEKAQTKNRG